MSGCPLRASPLWRSCPFESGDRYTKLHRNCLEAPISREQSLLRTTLARDRDVACTPIAIFPFALRGIVGNHLPQLAHVLVAAATTVLDEALRCGSPLFNPLRDELVLTANLIGPLALIDKY